MPEFPDITLYVEALKARVRGRKLERIRLGHPFLLRTAVPPLSAIEGKIVNAIRRVGRRIALGLEGDYWLVLHLMIAGRLHWAAPSTPLARKRAAAAFDFANETLLFTEAATKKRASLHLLEGVDAWRLVDPGGLEPMECSLNEFTKALTLANHTLKRALTDPQLFSGIGNAYSDEILHAARLSPVTLTQKLSPAQIETLHRAVHETLGRWTDLLRRQAGSEFPEGVTAFRPEMAVHGKFGSPCPVCGAKVRRIRYASNETNYCPGCQTGGRLLADRSLSLLLKKDWPKMAADLD